MHAWFFWALAVVAVVASLLVVGQRHAVRSILALIVLLVATGGLYLLLAAPVAAVLQVALHAGVVMAIVLPVTLFLDLPDEAGDGVDVGPGGSARRFGVGLGVVLVVELAWIFQRVRGTALPAADLMPDAGPVAMALRVVAEYTPGFALIAMLLGVAGLGVVLLVRRETR